MDIMFVCSGGGHLAQLKQLESWYQGKERVWVTDDTVSTQTIIEGEKLIAGYFPVTRNVPNLMRNSLLAIKLIHKYKPKLIVSNGAAIAYPFFVLAKLKKIPTIYIEVYDRIDSKTLTGKLVEGITTEFLVQWESQQQLYPNPKLIGSLY